jgi:RNA 2',3'-cyclic 3'-phosphodiesterase
MRLFVAADIDEATRAQLPVVRDAMAAVLNTAQVPPRVTWVSAEAAHVTLRFIGETHEEAAKAIEQALLAAMDVQPFAVRWERLGTFGGTRNPRVIWVAPTSGIDEFARLAQRINDRLDPLIGPGEKRPFAPHLTIGRVRDVGKRVDWPGALTRATFSPTTTHVDHITLYQSRLSPKGPTYTALCRVNL